MSPLDNSLQQLRGARIALLGFGSENRALARFFQTRGIGFSVCDVDRRAVEKLRAGWDRSVISWHLGERYLESLEEFQWIFRSPGISTLLPEIEAARQNGVRVHSQTQLFFDLCPAPIIGVTGTKGKGTTAALLAQILGNNLDETVHLGGNIGVPPVGFLDSVGPSDRVILELSSFQLQDLRTSPRLAVILGVTQDHLDYHADVAEYVGAKSSICRYQQPDDWVVADLDNPVSQKLATRSSGCKMSYSLMGEADAWLEDDALWIKLNGRNEKLCCRRELGLQGDHNLKNSLAAAAAAVVAGVPAVAIAGSVVGFKGLPHRLQRIGERDGVTYIDDSASTTPEAAAAAVQSFATPLILIAGGSGKGADYGKLAEAVATSKVNSILLMGEETGRIAAALQKTSGRPLRVESGDSMAWAVDVAERYAVAGDTILLSPGCASFGMFEDYVDRAVQFRKYARLEPD